MVFVFFVSDKKVSHLLSCSSLTTTFANMLESPHDGCFTVFIKIKFSRFYYLTFSNRTFCTLLFVHSSSSESSKTPYRFAPLNILVVLFFTLRIAISYVVLPVIVEDWFTILLNKRKEIHNTIQLTRCFSTCQHGRQHKYAIRAHINRNDCKTRANNIQKTPRVKQTWRTNVICTTQ